MANTEGKGTFLEENIKESKDSRFVYHRIREGKKAYIYLKQIVRHKTAAKKLSKFSFQKIQEPILEDAGYIVFQRKVKSLREVFPNAAAFGSWAWSKESVKKALQKYNELEADGDPSYVIHPLNDYRTFEANFPPHYPNGRDKLYGS